MLKSPWLFVHFRDFPKGSRIAPGYGFDNFEKFQKITDGGKKRIPPASMSFTQWDNPHGSELITDYKLKVE